MDCTWFWFGVVGNRFVDSKVVLLMTQDPLEKSCRLEIYLQDKERKKTHWKCLPERKGRYNANALLFIDDVLGWPLTATPKNRKKTEKITGSYLPFP